VYSTIADARGSISTTQATLNQGSTVEIILPEATDKNEQQVTPSSGHSQVDPPAVLLIEKDNDIRDLVLTSLDSNGFETLGARNYQEALQWIDLYAAPIALVITDWDMPGISGLSLAERIALRHPFMRAVFITDHAIDPEVCEKWEEKGSRFLDRPFRLEKLLEIVNEMIVHKKVANLPPDINSSQYVGQ
jgi:DNA-binding NtrC family response regulator